MLLRILFVLLAIIPLAPSVEGGWFDNLTSYFVKPGPIKPPKIRVLIVHDQQGVMIEVKGKYKIYDPHNMEHISTRFVGKRQFMQAIREGIKWGEEFPGIFQLLIVPEEKSTTTLIDGVEYKGPIFVYDIGGSISIINEIPVEDFLSSTLAQQFSKKMPKEFLAAVAIAARTNAYYAAENPKNQYWSVDAQPANYSGYAAINSSNDIEKAVSDTRYMVMSNSAPSEEQVSTFPAEWVKDPSITNQQNISKITLDQANNLASKGEHAAQILMKAFPGMKIELIHYSSESSKKR